MDGTGDFYDAVDADCVSESIMITDSGVFATTLTISNNNDLPVGLQTSWMASLDDDELPYQIASLPIPLSAGDFVTWRQCENGIMLSIFENGLIVWTSSSLTYLSFGSSAVSSHVTSLLPRMAALSWHQVLQKRVLLTV